MSEVLIGIISILLLVAVPLVYKLRACYKEESIFEAVKWCVFYDSLRKERPEVRMRNFIFNLQHKLSIDQRYRITKDEMDAINEILLRFRQEVIQEYFCGHYQKRGFSFEENLTDYFYEHQDEQEYRYNITYHKMYYILQLNYLKLHNIVGEDKIGVRSANATKETIDNILEK